MHSQPREDVFLEDKGARGVPEYLKQQHPVRRVAAGIRRQVMDEQESQGGEAAGGRSSRADVYENLRIHMVHGDTSKTAAFVSCKILTPAGALFLNSMALVRGANGLYLSFPSRKR